MHRSTFLPLQHAATLIFSVDWGLAIRNFGSTFVALQDERHCADYDPDAEFTRFDTVHWINRAEAAITNFMATTAAERKAFAAQVLFRNR